MNDHERFARARVIGDVPILGETRVFDLDAESCANVLAQLAGQTRNPALLNHARALAQSKVALDALLAVCRSAIVQHVGETIRIEPSGEGRPDNGAEEDTGNDGGNHDES